jgi:hypothetical protein
MAAVPQPPRLARTLVGWFVPASEREFVLGDLEETFAARVAAGAGRRAARRSYWRAALSSIASVRRHSRFSPGTSGRGAHPMASLTHDIRFALRSLLRTPGFTLVALTVLALGLGASTAVFSVVDAVVLRPLPLADPDRLINVTEISASGRGFAGSVAPQNFRWPVAPPVRRRPAGGRSGCADERRVIRRDRRDAGDLFISDRRRPPETDRSVGAICTHGQTA